MQSQSLIIQKEGNSLYPLLYLFNLKHFFVDQHCNYKTFLLSHSRIEQSPAVLIRVVVVYDQPGTPTDAIPVINYSKRRQLALSAAFFI
jgi:hypothetical protein